MTTNMTTPLHNTSAVPYVLSYLFSSMAHEVVSSFSNTCFLKDLQILFKGEENSKVCFRRSAILADLDQSRSHAL